MYLGPAFGFRQLIAFGAVALGESHTERLELEVRTEEQLLTELALVNGDTTDFNLSGGDCQVDVRLVPDKPCTLEITFSPVEEGAREAILQLSIEPGLSRQLRLVGTGGIIVKPPDSEIQTVTDANVSTSP